MLTLEDQTALYHATLFPARCRRSGNLLAPGQGQGHAYAVTGLGEEQLSAVTLTVKALRLLPSPRERTPTEPIEDVAG